MPLKGKYAPPTAPKARTNYNQQVATQDRARTVEAQQQYQLPSSAQGGSSYDPTDLLMSLLGGGGSAGGSSSGGGGGGAAVAAAVAQQRDALNKLYNDQLSTLSREVAGGKTSIADAGAQLHKTLNGLGTDAQQQENQVTGKIRATTADASATAAAALAATQKDLSAQGFSTAEPTAQGRTAATQIAGDGARQDELSQRYAQVLGQSMNDRQATASQLTTGSQDDLSRSQALQTSSIEQAREQALFQLQQAAAASAAHGGGGGGGSGGGSSQNPYTVFSDAKTLAGLLNQDQTNPLADAFSGSWAQPGSANFEAQKAAYAALESGSQSPLSLLYQAKHSGSGEAITNPVQLYMKYLDGQIGHPSKAGLGQTSSLMGLANLLFGKK